MVLHGTLVMDMVHFDINNLSIIGNGYGFTYGGSGYGMEWYNMVNNIYTVK